MSRRGNQPGRSALDADTGAAMERRAQPGYYPGFSTLAQQNYWDASTRALVLDRVRDVPPIRFFTAHEAHVLRAVCDRVLPQDDRDREHRIPIVPHIDKRLFENALDGYRYESMPPDREAYRLGVEAIEIMSRELRGRSFRDLEAREQDAILQSLHDGKPAAAAGIWDRMPVRRFWMLLLSDCAEAYYSHPWAWDEIGFGGPAYPRAYMRLEHGQAEPWEVQEKRYAWRAPLTEEGTD